MITVKIPAAIRACSPVVALVPTAGGDRCFSAGASAVVSCVESGELSIEGGWFSPSEFALIISDPTGAAHLAWWLLAPEQARGFARMAQAIDATGWTFDGRLQILNMAARGEAVGETALGHMRDYAHHIAGVTNG